ncbi:hypothetical protein CHUAL_006304 [Chamberlinius hualienensis]
MSKFSDFQPIQLLPDELRSRLRSEYCIDSVTSCVKQLVYNSVEAESKNVIVRLDLSFFNIQIIDDGHGITQKNLKLVGERYATNKFKEKQSGWRGKGESLSSIVSMSSNVQIDSKVKNGEQICYSKFMTQIEQRQSVGSSNSALQTSSGTSVTVRDFLNSVPVRRKLIQPTVEAEKVKKLLQEFSIVYPNISFSLFDEVHNVWRLKTPVFKSLIDVFCHHFGGQWQSKCRQFSTASGPFEIEGLAAFYDGYRNKSLQFIYVHNRRISCHELQEFLAKKLTKFCCPENYFPVFMINIRCPISLCTLFYNQCRISVEFQNFDILTNLISQILGQISGTEQIHCQDLPENSRNFELECKIAAFNEKSSSSFHHLGIKSHIIKKIDKLSPPILNIEDDEITHKSMRSSLAVKRPYIEPLFKTDNCSAQPQKIYLSSNKSFTSPLTNFCIKMSRQQRLDNAIKDLAKYGRSQSNLTNEPTATCFENNINTTNKSGELAVEKLPPRPWSKFSLEKAWLTIPKTVARTRQDNLPPSLTRLPTFPLPSMFDEARQHVKGFTPSVEINPSSPPSMATRTRHLQADATSLNCSVTKSHLKNIKVIGQVDSRFISAVSQLSINDDRHILLFDQHAVHERILLERFTKDAVNTTRLEAPMTVELNESQRSLAMNGPVANKLADLGLKFQQNGNLVEVVAVPVCFANKEESKLKLKQSSVLCKLIIETVEDVIQSVLSTGTGGSVLPKTMIELLRSQACHAAVKFGEYLPIETCDQLLKQLSKCDLPFHCAHGRPSVVPLIQIRK